MLGVCGVGGVSSGGMTRRVSSGHGTLAARVAGRRTGVRLPANVWVVVEGVRYPGILLEWLRGDGGWQARVAWASSSSAVHVEVLSADSVSPLPGSIGG